MSSTLAGVVDSLQSVPPLARLSRDPFQALRPYGETLDSECARALIFEVPLGIGEGRFDFAFSLWPGDRLPLPGGPPSPRLETWSDATGFFRWVELDLTRAVGGGRPAGAQDLSVFFRLRHARDLATLVEVGLSGGEQEALERLLEPLASEKVLYLGGLAAERRSALRVCVEATSWERTETLLLAWGGTELAPVIRCELAPLAAHATRFVLHVDVPAQADDPRRLGVELRAEAVDILELSVQRWDGLMGTLRQAGKALPWDEALLRSWRGAHSARDPAFMAERVSLFVPLYVKAVVGPQGVVFKQYLGIQNRKVRLLGRSSARKAHQGSITQ